jgi:hypothetical protein
MTIKIKNPTKEKLLPYLGRKIKTRSGFYGKLVLVSNGYIAYIPAPGSKDWNMATIESQLSAIPDEPVCIVSDMTEVCWWTINAGFGQYIEILDAVYDISKPASQQDFFY